MCVYVFVYVCDAHTHSQALLEGSPPQYLIPPVEYAINTTECLCSSMKDLASDINTPFEHDCSTTPDCDGVVCHVDILIRSYIMVMYILSCEDPPAVAVALGDPQGNVVWTYYINDNFTTLTIIDGFPVVVVSYIVHHTYSMDIEVSWLHSNTYKSMKCCIIYGANIYYGNTVHYGTL